tara:strand:+ start:316 stop:651 length:336 start_codon:yes stop_codon:yes gene_type:complete
MKYLLLVAVMALLSGCNDPSNQTPGGLNSADRPLTLVVVGKQGVVIEDGIGNLHTYNESYHFAQAIMSSGLKAGDVISSKEGLHCAPVTKHTSLESAKAQVLINQKVGERL